MSICGSVGGMRPLELRGGLLVAAQTLLVVLYFAWWRPRVLGGSFAEVAPLGGHMSLQILTAMGTWPDALAWLVAPFESTTSDVVLIVQRLFEPMALAGVALLLTAPFVWLRLLRRGNALAALGWAWLWLGFLPTSGLVPTTHAVAVRYLSLSTFGAALILCAILSALVQRFPSERRPLLAALLAGLLVAGLAQRSWDRIPDWRSDQVLFSRDLERDPSFREGYYVLAVSSTEDGELEEAKKHLDTLLQVNASFGARHSFLRLPDVLLLWCRINLKLGFSDETLKVMGSNITPDSSLLHSAPDLLLCGARSLNSSGRSSEARAVYRALGKSE
jgi:hypothetical protein